MSFIRKIKRSSRIYLTEVKSESLDGQVIQKLIPHIGKEVDSQKVISSLIYYGSHTLVTQAQ